MLEVPCANFFPENKSLIKRYLTDIVLKDIKNFRRFICSPMKEGLARLSPKAFPTKSRGKFQDLVFWPHQSLDIATTPCHPENHSVIKRMDTHTRLKI